MLSMLLGYDHDMVVTGDLAYVGGEDGLYVLDISDPSEPEQLSLYDGSGFLNSLALDGATLYVSGSDFVALDISTPDAPSEIGSCGASGQIAISGTHAYVGLSVIDISDPSTPHVVGSLSAPGSTDVAVLGPYALVAVGRSLRVFNVKDPASPEQVGFYDTLGTPRAVTVVDDLVYVADEDGGLVILNLTEGEIVSTFLPLIVR
jgi:hypothetical protein